MLVKRMRTLTYLVNDLSVLPKRFVLFFLSHNCK